MEDQVDTLHCKSCAAPITGIYCAQCGQKVIQRRFTMRAIFDDVFNQISNVDHGLIYTFLMLFKKPDRVVLDYLAGKTIKYSSPFKYLIFWTAVSALIYIGLGFYDQQVAGMDNFMHSADDQKASEFGRLYNDLMKQNFQLVSILYIPLFAIFTWWFFKKSEFNYAEHLVANAYFSAQASIVFIPVLLFNLNIELISTLSMLIMILYYTYAIRMLFKQGWLATFFKVILIYLLSMFLFAIVASIVLIPYIFWQKQ
ncbi:MAG: DUF3667 domain-containing protein [Haliscomenobacter sp.]|uniref:DUF3667 domain-containing protein n=1 Tax=Haliscomenobacter sp. TaxID=2717303 RepID=UPI0029AADDC6|nr:DUF3667 domain-containing protein [Haliscomenobacter sp.]MDX2070976.1 DUF3667 domain-containing protein [Haliscomenobacter sp.]